MTMKAVKRTPCWFRRYASPDPT